MSGALKRKWDQLRDVLGAKGASQVSIAKDSGVSQATISRVLERCPRRNSKAFARLCKYALLEEPSGMGAADPATSPLLMEALRDTWDGTPEHAKALADILRAVNAARNVTKP
jgi:hypothetical protein